MVLTHNPIKTSQEKVFTRVQSIKNSRDSSNTKREKDILKDFWRCFIVVIQSSLVMIDRHDRMHLK